MPRKAGDAPGHKPVGVVFAITFAVVSAYVFVFLFAVVSAYVFVFVFIFAVVVVVCLFVWLVGWLVGCLFVCLFVCLLSAGFFAWLALKYLRITIQYSIRSVTKKCVVPGRLNNNYMIQYKCSKNTAICDTLATQHVRNSVFYSVLGHLFKNTAIYSVFRKHMHKTP